MGKVKNWLRKQILGDIFHDMYSRSNIAKSEDASGARELITGLIKRVGIRFGDVSSSDFEDPEFDLTSILNGCNTDSYLRQGVDKYIDQIFKEGYDFYGKDSSIVDYVKLRFEYMAEATATPTGVMLTEMAEDVVKYSNCIMVKARAKDQTVLPEGTNIVGLNGKDPVGGYFCINPTTLKVKRDKNGTIKGWQQEVEGADKPVKFNPEDVVHIYYKREKGNAFGTSFLLPVLDDVRALRQAEENVLRMMYRSIYPFYHVQVGEKDAPGTQTEIDNIKSEIDGMDVESGLVTSSRVNIKPVVADRVIDAEPYLRYMEERIFSGMGIPSIMFGRGDTANRSTGDNMASEMSDRIKAIQRTIETFFNTFVVKELLMEGGYDPVLNPDQIVEFRFRENDLDTKVKTEAHAVFLYENNSITEDEMRAMLGRDPITDRALMYQTLITQANIAFEEQVKAQNSNATSTSKVASQSKTSQAKNIVKPTNQHGTKTSPKKTTNSHENENIINDYLNDCYKLIVDYVINNSLEEGSDLISSLVESNAKILKDTGVDVSTHLKQIISYVVENANKFNDKEELICLIDLKVDLMKNNIFKNFSKEE